MNCGFDGWAAATLQESKGGRDGPFETRLYARNPRASCKPTRQNRSNQPCPSKSRTLDKPAQINLILPNPKSEGPDPEWLKLRNTQSRRLKPTFQARLPLQHRQGTDIPCNTEIPHEQHSSHVSKKQMSSVLQCGRESYSREVATTALRTTTAQPLLSQLQKLLLKIVREPHDCFEEHSGHPTSSNLSVSMITLNRTKTSVSVLGNHHHGPVAKDCRISLQSTGSSECNHTKPRTGHAYSQVMPQAYGAWAKT